MKFLGKCKAWCDDLSGVNLIVDSIKVTASVIFRILTRAHPRSRNQQALVSSWKDKILVLSEYCEGHAITLTMHTTATLPPIEVQIPTPNEQEDQSAPNVCRKYAKVSPAVTKADA